MRARTPWDMGSIVRGRRIRRGLSQARLAALSGVSRKWVYEFEAGKPAAELSPILRVLAALELRLDLSPTELVEAESRRTDSIDLDEHLDRYQDR